MYEDSHNAINEAITSANNPDLTSKQRREVKRQLRYYLSHETLPDSVKSRCQYALQEVSDIIPWYFNPYFVGIFCGVVFFLLGYVSNG